MKKIALLLALVIASRSWAVEPEADALKKAQETVAALTLPERISQLMLVTLDGLLGPGNQDREILKDHLPGGVIIPLAGEPAQAADYIRTLRALSLAGKSKIPLFIGADIVSLTRHDSRIQSTFVQMPQLLSIAAAGDMATMKSLAELIAEHLDTMGFNMSVGPSLELAPSLPGAKTTLSTLGDNPAFTAQAAAVLSGTLAEKGIIVMPTGFPGGGANRVGKEPATLTTPRAKLLEEDALPYARALECQVPMLHVGNTLVPTLDDKSASASLSHAAITDFLRGQMGYKGIVVAGPIDAPDILNLYEVSAAVQRALNAGATMILWSQGGERLGKCIANLARSVEQGKLDESVINAAAAQVVMLKNERRLAGQKMPDEKKAKALDSKKRFAEEAYAIERRSITLLKNDGNVLPLSKKGSMPVGVTGIIGVEEMKAALEKYIKPVVEQPIGSARHVGDIEDFEIKRLTSDGGSIRTAICMFSEMKRTAGQVRLIRALKAAGSRVVVVYFGAPGPVADFLEADAIVLAFCAPEQCAGSLRAAADVIAGDCPIRIAASAHDIDVKIGAPQVFDAANVVRAPAGRLPVAIGEYQAGHGATYAPQSVVKKAMWDFGDGTREHEWKIEHAFKAAGTYPVTLTVTDRSGREQSATFTIVAK